jgi:hypothetical protein
MNDPESNIPTKIQWNTLVSFILVASGIHIALMYGLLTYKNGMLLVAIHGFLAVLLVAAAMVVNKVSAIDNKKVGLAFLAITIFKMLLSIGFLLLMFKVFDVERNLIIFNFFGPFFLYLLFEVVNSLNQLR